MLRASYAGHWKSEQESQARRGFCAEYYCYIFICVLFSFLLVLAVMSIVIIIVGMSGFGVPDALSAWGDAVEPSTKHDFRRLCRDAHRMQKCLFPMHLLVLKKPILQWCGSFLRSLCYSGAYSLKPEHICLRKLPSYHVESVNIDLFLSLTHSPCMRCMRACFMYTQTIAGTRSFLLLGMLKSENPLQCSIYGLIVLRRLIFRSTKMGPSFWELPHMVLGYWLEPLSEDVLHTRGEFSRRSSQQSRGDMRIFANMNGAALDSRTDSRECRTTACQKPN